jgi:diguanylate cyclase (GGDEF)-like protein/PAS domain S-box-containing protein
MSLDQNKNTHELRTLPLRVAGIVFWGLVVLGFVFALFTLDGRESQIRDQQQSAVDRFTAQLYQAFASRPGLSARDVGEVMRSLVQGSARVDGVLLEMDGERVRIGQTGAGHVAYQRTMPVDAGQLGEASFTLYLPSVRDQLGSERKDLLLAMGAVFLLFGFVLQGILDQMLSRPFRQMVTAAQAFSAGDGKVRFDERRSDEFGYLGRFINQALDYSMQQNHALHRALARICSSERELQAEKEKAVVTLHSIGDAVITTNHEGRVEYMNPVAEELLGWRLSDIQHTPLGKVMRLIEEDSGESLRNPVDLCLQRKERIVEKGHKLLVRHDGREIAIADSAAPILDQRGALSGVVMVFHDVGQSRNLARQLSFQACHDPLTGLFNRREFEARLGQLLGSAHNEGKQHAVCYMDLDQFKLVNDVSGHGAGDELLRQLAALLQAQVREADILARLGGDEFGVLLEHCSAEQAVRIAENIRSAVRDFRFLYADRSFEIGVSIGVVAINRDSRSTSELMSAADIACYAAKDGGRNRVHLYEPSDAEVTERRGEMNWVSEVRAAMQEGRLYLLFQPIVSLAHADPGHPSHCELLLRMRDSLGNEVLPMAFLPAAERYNLMTEIDRWVVATAMRLLGQRTLINETATLLINLSGKSLSDASFVDYLEKELSATAMPCRRICFEIAEASAISNIRSIGDSIARLRRLGCRFALDDFGSGLSSFGYLKDLHIDYIKIDGGFVKDMMQDEMDAAMVRAINDIGHLIGARTIAEFVESDKILESLARLGVDYGQGHFISTPRPIEELFKPVHRKPSLSLINS